MIHIPGDPPLWRRPMVVRRGRSVRLVSDPGTVADEARVALFARVARVPPFERYARVDVEVVAVHPRPQARPAWASREAWATEKRIPRSVTPDADNVGKAILDGLTLAGVWADDGQVGDLRVSTWCAAAGEAPHTVVTVCHHRCTREWCGVCS